MHVILGNCFVVCLAKTICRLPFQPPRQCRFCKPPSSNWSQHKCHTHPPLTAFCVRSFCSTIARSLVRTRVALSLSVSLSLLCLSLSIQAALTQLGHDADLVQIVSGFGETGAALIPRVDKLVFIGSPQVGKLVMREASKTLTPVVLELGGGLAWALISGISLS